MIRNLFRSFFFAVLVASVAAWVYVGTVSASHREAVLIDDRFTGISEQVVAPGQTRFVAARAVPGRVRLHRVRVRPRVLSYPYRIGLARSEILGLDDSFYVRIESRLEYELATDSLADLFKKLDAPDWRELDDYIARRVRVLWNARFAGFYEDDGDIPGLENDWRLYFQNAALQELNTLFQNDGIVFQRIDIGKIYVPDRAAYQNVLDGSGDLLQEKLARIRRIEDAEARQAAEMIRDRAYYARLERIGGLLRQFPELKDYLAIDRLSDKVEVMVVPYEHWFPGQARQRGRQSTPAPARPRSRARDFLPGPLRGLDPTRPEQTRPGTPNAFPVPPAAGGGFRDLTPP